MEFRSAVAHRVRMRAGQGAQTRPACAPARRNDEGFTLIELVVALGILAVGILSATQVYFGALNVHANIDVRTAGEKLASQQLELVRTTPYAAAAIPSGAPIPTTFEGENIVFSASGAVQPGPDAITFNGSTFSVERRVTERTDPGGVPYRHLTIDVLATVNGPGSGITLRQESAIYEGRGFDTAPPDPPASTTPDPPSAFTAAAPLMGDPTTDVDLTWVPSAATPQLYDLYYSSNNGVNRFLLEKGIAGSKSSWTVNGLAADTDYEFSIRARNGNLSSLVSYTNFRTAAVFPLPVSCRIGLVSISPEENPLSPPYRVSQNIRVTANTNGGCLFGVMAVTHSDGGDLSSLMTMSGQVGRLTISRFGSIWQTGPKSIDIVDVSTGTVVAHVGFSVTG